MQNKPKYPRKVRSTEKVTYGVDSPQKKQEKRKLSMTSETRLLEMSNDNVNAAVEAFLLSMRLIDARDKVAGFTYGTTMNFIIQREAIN